MENNQSSTIKECKISFLQHEYVRYSKLIYNQVQHIEKLYREGFIYSQQRLSSLSTLNHLIRYMNQDVYNAKLKELKVTSEQQYNNKNSDELDENDSLELSKTHKNSSSCEKIEKNEIVGGETSKSRGKLVEQKEITEGHCLSDLFNLGPLQYNVNTTNIDVLFDICRLGKIGNINYITFDDFNKVADKLIKLGNDIGFKSIYNALELLIGSSHQELIKDNATTNATGTNLCDQSQEDKLKDFRDQLTLINECFIPIKFVCIDNYKENQPFFIDCSINENSSNSDAILQPYGTVSICFPHYEKKFQFDGYFPNDPLQSVIRTCQISKPFLYKKKKQLQTYTDEVVVKSVNQKFANIYIKNISVGEILAFTKEQFVSKLQNDFNRYVKLSKMTFRNLMEEFMQEPTKDSQGQSSNLKNMYTIIKLLLLGPDDCINMAGLLFGLTKDKKNGSEIVADLIYNNLSLPLQTKLKRSSLNIKSELDKIKNLSDDEMPLEKIVAANTKIPLHIKKIIFSKLLESKTQNTENAKNKLLADTLIRFPHINDDTTFIDLNKDQKRSCEFMNGVMKTLNEKIYGHSECKNAINELICSWILNPTKMGKAIALNGPPGVGKTLIAKALGQAIGVPVRCISLCGMEDGSVLNGHSFTYSNAQPGLLVREMCEAGAARCILFFDEVDKTSKRHNIDEIQNILINLTDPNMNDKFNDKFIQDVHFSFRHVLMIFTYNDKSAIDPVLLNRLHEIEVKPYTTKDKLKICKEFLLKEITEDINLEYGSIKISEDDIKYVIENYTYESGVRELKRQIETLFLKLNVDRLYQKGLFACECKKNSGLICTCSNIGLYDKYKDCVKCNFPCTNNCKLELNKEHPVTCTRDILNIYLPRAKIHFDKIHTHNLIGGVNGLYATSTGNGGLVTIIVQKNITGSNTNFEIKLTGSQGKVMKESVQFAWDTISNLIKEEYISEFINKHKSGISVHALDGATNKDGPSAGCAFGTAFVSLILGLPIKNTIAMTGEIGIHGECKEIGGLVSKLYGAKRAGVKLVCIPESNGPDLVDILAQDPELLNDFQVKKCKYIHDILPHVFEDGFDEQKYFKQ